MAMRFALLIFIVVPIIEMVVLIEVGGIIGALPTVGLVVLTATLGIWLLRLEGLATLARVQEKLARGEIPGTELLEGIMLLVGGALLLTPGFVTDAIGFTCILPGLRRPIARWMLNRGILSTIQIVSSGPGQSGPGPSGPGRPGPGNNSGSQPPNSPTTIEGEFSENDQHR